MLPKRRTCSTALSPSSAGFPISGHILRSEHGIMDLTETEHVPLAALEPLSTIRIAIKHKQKKFLAQNCVHEYMRKEWVGGGTDDFSSQMRGRYNAFWLLSWWIVVPYNLLVMTAIAIYPPLAAKYSKMYTKLFKQSGVPSQVGRLHAPTRETPSALHPTHSTRSTPCTPSGQGLSPPPHPLFRLLAGPPQDAWTRLCACVPILRLGAG